MTFLNYLKVLVEKIHSLVVELIKKKRKKLSEKKKKITSATSLKGIVSNKSIPQLGLREESLEEYNINDPQSQRSGDLGSRRTLEDLDYNARASKKQTRDFKRGSKDSKKRKLKDSGSNVSRNFENQNNLSNFVLSDKSKDKKSETFEYSDENSKKLGGNVGSFSRKNYK